MPEQNNFHKLEADDLVSLGLSPGQPMFARLVALADLRDRLTDAAREGECGKEQIAAAVEQKHRGVFHAWLWLSGAAQMEEVSQYLTDQAGIENITLAQMIERWLREKLYEPLKPAVASQWELELFSRDLRTVLHLLKVKQNHFANRHGA